MGNKVRASLAKKEQIGVTSPVSLESTVYIGIACGKWKNERVSTTLKHDKITERSISTWWYNRIRKVEREYACRGETRYAK